VRLDRNPLLPTHEHRLTTGLTVLPRSVTFTQADALHDHPWVNRDTKQATRHGRLVSYRDGLGRGAVGALRAAG